MTRFALFVSFVVLAASCGDTGGAFIEVPYSTEGTAAEPFISNGWEVTLTEAALGFGSIFFCTTESPLPNRCEVAIIEDRDGLTVDGLDPEPQPVGSLFGTTGTIRTAFFNYGIVWLLTNPVPQALAGVPGGPAAVPFENPSYVPAGHSGRFSGTAECVEGPEVCCPAAESCPASFVFEANIDVTPNTRGEPAVNGVRTDVDIADDPVSLTVSFDANAWWQAVDFTRLAALADGTGPVVLAPNDPDYSAMVIAMTSTDPPTFTWTLLPAEP